MGSIKTNIAYATYDQSSPAHQPMKIKYNARIKKFTCCVPLMLIFVVLPVMLIFIDWLAGLSVKTTGKRLSIIRPIVKPIIVMTKKYPMLSQISPAHQPMKMKYNVRVNRPC